MLLLSRFILFSLLSVFCLSSYAEWDGGDVTLVNETGYNIIVYILAGHYQCMESFNPHGGSYTPGDIIVLKAGETKVAAYHEEEKAAAFTSCATDSTYYYLNAAFESAPYIFVSNTYDISHGSVSLEKTSNSVAGNLAIYRSSSTNDPENDYGHTLGLTADIIVNNSSS
ncbi:hypothetical protein [Piscirickettsia litoralis]|uniref:Uncharacterized protein n=1 Tax=Piscirickettsia litoralis TaxID=1891921 RepID=A0ABX3A0Y8_9GAMM|nr:hypothetical protein [Piscirickettsia litoralis]ODN42478.1 hypothetical protein BGC07_05475 [Piscirickettsia litoralis]